MSSRAVSIVTAIVLAAGCGGEQASKARPPDGGGGMVTGSGGLGGAGSAGTGAAGDAGETGSAGTTGGAGDTAGTSGSGGDAGSAGSAGGAGVGGSAGATGGAGTAGVSGRGGTGAGGTAGGAGAAGVSGRGGSTGGGTAGSAGTAGSGVGGAGGGGGTAPLSFPCPVVINGSLDSTDQTQTGRENRVTPTGICGGPKAFPGNAADPTNPHFFDRYRFVNPALDPTCFNFTLTYDGAGGLQRYATAYTSYDPTMIQNGYVSDVGAVLTSPQTMGVTVPAGGSIEVVVFAIEIAPVGVGPYTLSCEAVATGGTGGTGGGAAGAGGTAGGAGGAGGSAGGAAGSAGGAAGSSGGTADAGGAG